VGCIFAELLNGKPILPGKNEVCFYEAFNHEVYNLGIYCSLVVF
jgi:hypothetical protein